MIQYLRICAALALLAPAAVAAETAMPDWMSGAWLSEADPAQTEDYGWTEEYWTSPRGGIMIGGSRTGAGPDLLNWEHMRIEREADGTLVFWALPGGTNATRFVAVHADSDDVIFENAANDYPQRVRYWREGKELKAQISLMDGSQPMDFSWGMMGQ